MPDASLGILGESTLAHTIHTPRILKRRHFRRGGIDLLALGVERGMADGHGGDATKDGGSRYAFPP
jgi:hypothetical protein